MFRSGAGRGRGGREPALGCEGGGSSRVFCHAALQPQSPAFMRRRRSLDNTSAVDALQLTRTDVPPCHHACSTSSHGVKDTMRTPFVLFVDQWCPRSPRIPLCGAKRANRGGAAGGNREDRLADHPNSENRPKQIPGGNSACPAHDTLFFLSNTFTRNTCAVLDSPPRMHACTHKRHTH
jgi:hypothetical protein